MEKLIFFNENFKLPWFAIFSNLIFYVQRCLSWVVVRIGEHGIGEHGIGEHGIGEYGIGENGICEHGIGEHGIGKYGIGEYGIGEMQCNSVRRTYVLKQCLHMIESI